jgi:hypothetical protein
VIVKLGRGRVALLADLLPPAADRRDREARGVVVGAYRHPGAVGGRVIDAVGVRATQLADEVMHVDRQRVALGTQLAPAVFELPDELIFLASTEITG